MDVFTYCDDSSGALSDTLAYAADLLKTIAFSELSAIAIKEQVFDFF